MEACLDTWRHHNGRHFKLHLVTDANVDSFLPRSRRPTAYDYLNPLHKSDFLR
jgi:hypothetical protein